MYKCTRTIMILASNSITLHENTKHINADKPTSAHTTPEL